MTVKRTCKRGEGSSPRMRGALGVVRTSAVLPGIIPAYAGSTVTIIGSLERYRDHPRVCGEHCVYSSLLITTMGSSPRMRGALTSSTSNRRSQGIIPAHAGSTSVEKFQRQGGKDHPRVCGEHMRISEVGARLRGSSPRMRGALAQCRSTGTYGCGSSPRMRGAL